VRKYREIGGNQRFSEENILADEMPKGKKQKARAKKGQKQK
jgi:hypothetical protein